MKIGLKTLHDLHVHVRSHKCASSKKVGTAGTHVCVLSHPPKGECVSCMEEVRIYNYNQPGAYDKKISKAEAWNSFILLELHGNQPETDEYPGHSSCCGPRTQIPASYWYQKLTKAIHLHIHLHKKLSSGVFFTPSSIFSIKSNHTTITMQDRLKVGVAQ